MTAVNSPTNIDNLNATKYAYHQYLLRFIPRWRRRFPNILIDYDVRPATNDDFYVPPGLRDTAVFVNIKFSRRGCESMSCFPFHETGPITSDTGFGYTQTSDTAQGYAQPACYHLDRSAATREGDENRLQSVELRYASNRCILMDTFAKMYMNSPYLRTEDHLIQGVDDVPGLNVTYGSDPHFPEKFQGAFNEAYCRRFGRDLLNNTCQTQWWETMIGFVLGDSIYITFKLLVNNIFSELRNFNYRRPSPVLPPPPVADSNAILTQWRNVRDPAVDEELEARFNTFRCLSDINLTHDRKLVYTAEEGYTFVNLPFKTYDARVGHSVPKNTFVQFSDSDLDDIMAQFLLDHELLFSIFTDLGFDQVMSNFAAALKKINTTLLPRLKTMLLNTSTRVTARLMTAVWKANVVNMLSHVAIKTVTAMAKALTRIAIKASSVIGIVLIALSLADLVLMFWDPFGYSNMFPREFPDDLADSFLISYYEAIGESRDMIEFYPIFFSDMLEEHDGYALTTAVFIWEYLGLLDVNSDGQLLAWDEDEAITDFDEVTLVGAALASSAMYTRAEFHAYTERHTKVMRAADRGRNSLVDHILAFLFLVCAGVTWLVPERYALGSLVIIFILIAVFQLVSAPMLYFAGMRDYAAEDPINWYKNLYEQ